MTTRTEMLAAENATLRRRVASLEAEIDSLTAELDAERMYSLVDVDQQ